MLQFRQTQGFKKKEKKNKKREKRKRGELVCEFWKYNKIYKYFVYIGLEECSSARKQDGHTSIQNQTTFLLLQTAKTYWNCEMAWWSPEFPYLWSTHSCLGCCEYLHFWCVVNHKWISTSIFGLLSCFCSVQFAEALSYGLDSEGRGRGALSGWTALHLFLEKLHCLKTYFFPTLRKLALAWLFHHLLKYTNASTCWSAKQLKSLFGYNGASVYHRTSQKWNM